MRMEQWWNGSDRGTPRHRRETCHSAILSATNHIWPGEGSNEVLRRERPETDCLGHDTTAVARTVLVRLPACTDSSLQSLTGSDDHPASYANGPRSPAVKRSKRESDHLPIHLVQRLRMRGAVPLLLLECCFTKHKENSIFMFYDFVLFCATLCRPRLNNAIIILK